MFLKVITSYRFGKFVLGIKRRNHFSVTNRRVEFAHIVYSVKTSVPRSIT